MRYVGLLFLLLWVHSSWAASIQVQAQLSASTLYLGDSVVLEVRIDGVREPDLPEITHPDLEVTNEGGQSFSNSSISIINGRTTRLETFGYTARYRLRPLRAGILHLPPIAITHEGHTYRSQPLTLTVKLPSEQDLLLVEVSTDKPSYVVGETVTLTLEVSLRKLTVNGKELDADPFFPKQPPQLHIPWFERLGDWKTTDLQTFVQPFLNQQRPGFFINDYYDQSRFFGRERLTFTLPRQSTRRQRASGTFSYFTYRLQKAFRPIRTARQTIPPVLVKATLPTEIDARGRAQRTETVVASSQPLTVDVHPVPSLGQPASFSGGVGRFRFQVDAAPTTLKVGDPLTLTVTVYGEADSLLETVHPLPLQNQSALVQDFKLQTDPPTVKTDNDSKTFIYTIRPRHAEIRAIPSLEMAYYDPDTGRFHVMHSKPISLEVEKASTLEASDIMVALSQQPSKSRLGRQLMEGLLANYTGTEVLVPQQAELRMTPVLGGLLILPPLAYVLTLLLRRQAQQRQQQPGRQRRKRAARTAMAALQQLTRLQGTSEADICEAVHRILTGYLCDKLDLQHASLTVADVTHYLQTRSVEPTLIDQSEALFHLCDSVRYAPGSLAVSELTHLIEDAKTFVQGLEASQQL